MSATTTVRPATYVDERVSLTFAAKGNARTKWLEIAYPVDAVPTNLFDALEAIGFTQSPAFANLPPVPASTFDRSLPFGQQMVDLGYIEQETSLTKPGTDLFAGWTVEEERANMAQARRVLRRFGFTRVPVWKKTLADLM